ncbi:MAG: L-threonylcarbamoyladenylate synthase [Anaerovoracaceae bacterium]
MELKTKYMQPTVNNIKEAAKILKEGGLVAFPTETVYGLGANALDDYAVSKVYIAKGRPSDNPMIVHVATATSVADLAEELSEDAKRVMRAFWPGPLTLVLKAKSIVPKTTTGGLDTVAIRMPDNEIALRLIKEAGVPLAGPSANLSGKPSPTKAQHVLDDLAGRIDAVIEGGPCQVGIESTILDLSTPVPVILRPGKITKEQLTEVIGLEVQLDPTLNKTPDQIGKGFKPKAPGMKYKHYAPKAKMVILEGSKEAILKEIEFRKATYEGKMGVILFEDENIDEAAHDLFAALRHMDEKNVDLIVAAALTQEGVGYAVMNRMLKSAGGNVLKLDK